MATRPQTAASHAGIAFEQWLEMTRQWESGLHIRSRVRTAAAAAQPGAAPSPRVAAQR